MSPRKRIFVATHPFGAGGAKPRELLDASAHEIIYNTHGRRLRSGEIEEVLQSVHGVIAGTEPYPMSLLERCPSLEVISRVGIGLDNLDVGACRRRGIQVTHTPDAPSQAVAELTIAFIINLVRFVPQSDRSVREGAWNRMLGRLLEEITVGVVGVGRIGSRVIRLLQPFDCRILATDVAPEPSRVEHCKLEWVDRETLLRNSDVVSLHIPLTKSTRGFIGKSELEQMRAGAFLINTSRGPVVDESALVYALDSGHLAGAALDVFEHEPYEGPLAEMDQTLLTAHMAASARKSRYLMELDAAEDCLRVLAGESPAHPAPIESD